MPRRPIPLPASVESLATIKAKKAAAPLLVQPLLIYASPKVELSLFAKSRFDVKNNGFFWQH